MRTRYALALVVAVFVVVASVVVAIDMVLASRADPMGVVRSPDPSHAVYAPGTGR